MECVTTMNEKQNSPLQPLIAKATGYANFIMRKFGHIPPTLLAEARDGLILCVPERMENDKAKDAFTNIARLIAAAYAPKGVVMILESWMTRARPGGEPVLPPSKAPDREEVVVLQAEGPKSYATAILSIQRDWDGKFTGLENMDIPQFDEIAGRFTVIFPPKPLSEEQRELARMALGLIGVKPQRFDPKWN